MLHDVLILNLNALTEFAVQTELFKLTELTKVYGFLEKVKHYLSISVLEGAPVVSWNYY